MTLDRTRELDKTELGALPETRIWPPGARVVRTSASGTWEGHGFDGIVMSAGLDRYFDGPQRFDEVVAWYERHLVELGWPAGTAIDSAGGTRWHRWEWDLESIDLIDRVIGPDDPAALTRPEWRGKRRASELPPGWWAWSVYYQRKPPPGRERPAAFIPPSEDEQFDSTVRVLEKFVGREGHAEVPAEHVEEGINLGTWVANMRFMKANGDFPKGWAARLEQLPGWRWLSGSDLALLKKFALREGHTRVPEDHYEEGRPLGLIVRDWRRDHRWELAANPGI